MATRLELSTLASLTTVFVNRITVCVLFYAQFIIGEDTKIQGHVTRSTWAKASILNPQSVAVSIAPLVTIDPVFVGQKSPVGDWGPILDAMPETGAGSLQAAVENAINTTVLQF